MSKQSRKTFLDIFLGGSLIAWLGAMLYPVSKYLVPPASTEANPNSVEIGPVTEFPVNSSKIVRFGRKPVIIFRIPDGEFRAMSATCTHLDCTVQYKSDTQQIWCACHNGLYDLQGNNVSGPPPKPLTQFNVVINRGKIFITREGVV